MPIKFFLVEPCNKANIFLGLVEYELNSLVSRISQTIRFGLERYLPNILCKQNVVAQEIFLSCNTSTCLLVIHLLCNTIRMLTTYHLRHSVTTFPAEN